LNPAPETRTPETQGTHPKSYTLLAVAVSFSKPCPGKRADVRAIFSAAMPLAPGDMVTLAFQAFATSGTPVSVPAFLATANSPLRNATWDPGKTSTLNL